MKTKNIWSLDPQEKKQIAEIEIDLSGKGPLHTALNQFVDFTSRYQQPIVKPVTADIIPTAIRALSRMGSAQTGDNGICPHFFVDDSKIEPAWTKPFAFFWKLKKFGRCLSPDFSIFVNMVSEQKRWNSFRNKFLTALWQRWGIDVIAAPSWGDISDIEHYMEGWPTESLIAINSTGIGRDRRNRHQFISGYRAMVDILRPKHILRYGPKVEGELSEISTYYVNDAREEVKNGRK